MILMIAYFSLSIYRDQTINFIHGKQTLQQQKTNSDLCAPTAIPQHICHLSDMDFVPDPG